MDAGITVKPRTSRADRQQLGPVLLQQPLGPVLLRELYQDRQWSSPQIAAHLDTVLRTLHDHGIPVRRGGPPPRRTPDIDPRLTALYGDPEITALLRRYQIPRRHEVWPAAAIEHARATGEEGRRHQ